MSGPLWDWPNQQVVRADHSGPGIETVSSSYADVKANHTTYAALHAANADYADLLNV